LALGERRAAVTLDYLVGLGVAGSRLDTLSYGKEKPVCTESVESCWLRNRRAHFTLK
jgi:peptidoglycan-associated lipoprotein